MRLVAAALGSAAFLFLAPGVMAGVVPWLLTGWESTDPPLALAAVGVVLIVAGVVVVLYAFASFVAARGTPAPVAPTERLVVTGLYRFVRNPMYVAVTAIIAGQALLLGQWVLAGWALVFWATVAAFVRGYEEPTLSEAYGAQYEAYRRAVPGWVPRLRPWSPDVSSDQRA